MLGKVFTIILSAGLLVTQAANATTQQGVQALRAGDFQSAYGYLRIEALNGDPIAQFSMCGMYFQGQGVPQNDYEAFKWCKLAADQGHLEASYNLALFYQKGTGVGQNMNEAVKWYQAAAERGHKDAQFNLLQLYNANITDTERTNAGGAKLAAVVPPVGVGLDANGNPVTMNPMKAMDPAPTSPQQVNAVPQQQMAQAPMASQVVVPAPNMVAAPVQAPMQVASAPAEIPQYQYMATAQPQQVPAASYASVATAQVATAAAQAPIQAAAAAPEILTQAAAPVAVVASQAIPAQTLAPAQSIQAATPAPVQMAPVEQASQEAVLPPITRKPMTLEQQQAYNLQQGCLQAAQQGIAADNCEDDKPVIKQVQIAQVKPEQTVQATADIQNSIGWFEKQAELGDLAAQNNLGVMYRRGMGVDKNPAKAFDLFQKSAARGSPNGMLNLANMYKMGEGTEQNLELSYAWYNLAADRIPAGEMKKSALNNIKEISGYMDNEQIGDALAYVTKLDETIPLAE